MVTPRMQLERLENELMRIHTFLRHKPFMVNRVRDLSILTGADVLFLAFSPTGIPTICLGENSNFNGIITRFCETKYEERESRKLKNLQTLKTNYAAKGQDIDIDEISNGWKRRKLEDLDQELSELKAKLSDLNHKNSLWANPKSINDMEQIREMEESLRKSIDSLRKRMDHFDTQMRQTCDQMAVKQIVSSQNVELGPKQMTDSVFFQQHYLNPLKQPMYNEGQDGKQILVHHPQLTHQDTVYEGINENINPLMPQGNVGSSVLPTMMTQNVELGPQFSFQDPFQQPDYDFGGYENFGFSADLDSYGASSFKLFDQEVGQVDPGNFNPNPKGEEAGPSYRDNVIATISDHPLNLDSQ